MGNIAAGRNRNAVGRAAGASVYETVLFTDIWAVPEKPVVATPVPLSIEA